MNILEKKRRSFSTQTGFTLVEIIVATGLFAVVMLIAVGSLMSVIDANRKAQSQQIVLNNLSAALESISRNVRIGALYHCGASGSYTTPQNCPDGDGGSFFAFKPRDAIADPSQSTLRWIYRRNTESVEGSTRGFVEVSKDGGSTYARLTAPEIDVQGFTFYVVGSCPKTSGSGCTADDVQPRALITVYGFAQVSERTRTTFNIQTMVTQRLFDI